jgi:ParB-like chromosome segregation protein Spo0J
MAKKINAKAVADGVSVWCQHEALVGVDELKPNPKNPNTHPQRQIEMLAKNIRHFGWRHPITVSRRSGFIVAGHGRLMAAKHLCLKSVPVDFQDFASDADEMAVLVADNRLSEISGGWDWSILKGELDAILDGGEIDLSHIGFEIEDIPSDDKEKFGGDKDENSSGDKQKFLRFGDRKVPIGDEEIVGMMSLLDRHMEETGSHFGFAASLIEKCSR